MVKSIEGEVMELRPPTYKANVECPNCGWYGELEIEKGVKVGDAQCSYCGCIGIYRYVVTPIFKSRIRIGEHGEKIYAMTKRSSPIS